jgi:hypothetical protein
VGRDPDDLVLEAEQQAIDDGGLRGSVIGMARLPEDARGRADQHETPVAPVHHAAEEAAGGQEGRGQVLAQRSLPTFERELPDGHVVARPEACDCSADVELACLLEEALDLVLAGEIGLDQLHVAEGLGAVASLVVMRDDFGSFRRERPDAGRPDPARRAGDEHPLPAQTRLHTGKLLL